MTASAEGKLFDRLHQRFGIGTMLTEDEEPWRMRAREIAKIRAMVKKRGVSLESLNETVDYLIATDKTITQSWELFSAVPDAKRWKREQPVVTPVRERLEAAATEAFEMGEGDWVYRLTAASDDAAEYVLADWSEWKQDRIP